MGYHHQCHQRNLSEPHQLTAVKNRKKRKLVRQRKLQKCRNRKERFLLKQSQAHRGKKRNLWGRRARTQNEICPKIAKKKMKRRSQRRRWPKTQRMTNPPAF